MLFMVSQYDLWISSSLQLAVGHPMNAVEQFGGFQATPEILIVVS